MSSFSDTHAAIYEEPVDERIRKFLKLESYFLRINKHKEIENSYDSFAVLYNLISLYQMLSRAEVKRELIREIDFHKSRYTEYIKINGSDKIKLNSIMEKQNVILNTLHNLQSNYLNDLHNDELFQHCVKHYDTLSSELDYWLTRDSVWRTNNFDLWIEPLKFIKESTNFILTLIRKSGNFQDKNAEKGFYIQKLDQNKNIQLVRITLSSDVYYYPQISVGKQRINIMFMTKDEANNLVQYQEDVQFLLTVCCL